MFAFNGGREMDNAEFQRMEKSDRAVTRERPFQTGFKNSYYGVSSVILLAVTAAIFYFALGMLSLGVSCAFVPGSQNSGSDIKTGFIVTAFGFIALSFTLTCAGASVATGQQSFLGALVIGIVMLPIILFLGAQLFDMQLDLSALSGSPSDSSSSRSGNQC